MTVTNEVRTSKRDYMTVTVDPVSTIPPLSNEEPQTIYDIFKEIINNPLGITNSLESSQKITYILKDNNRDNDKLACDLLDDVEIKQMNRLKDAIGC